MMTSKIFAGIAGSFFMAVFFLLVSDVSGQVKVPKALAPYLAADKNYIGERGVPMPPKEIEKYYKLIKIGADKNPEWYEEYSDAIKPGEPLPFHKNLNLTDQEYKEYRAIWDKREFKVFEKLGVRLEQAEKDWRILTSGKDVQISLLRYDAEKDVFKSTNGEMKRIDNIEADSDTILGAWTGVEWRYEEETPIDRIKENFAIGKSVDGKYALIVYRLQHISALNTILFDENKVIRIPLK